MYNWLKKKNKEKYDGEIGSLRRIVAHLDALHVDIAVHGGPGGFSGLHQVHVVVFGPIRLQIVHSTYLSTILIYVCYPLSFSI